MWREGQSREFNFVVIFCITRCALGGVNSITRAIGSNAASISGCYQYHELHNSAIFTTVSWNRVKGRNNRQAATINIRFVPRDRNERECWRNDNAKDQSLIFNLFYFSCSDRSFQEINLTSFQFKKFTSCFSFFGSTFFSFTREL